MKTLQYRGTGTDYSEDGDPLVLKSMGCGCCSQNVPLTQENLDEAIQDARDWLEYLESLDANA